VAAAAAGSSCRNQADEDTSETQWRWIAFAILAVGVIVFAIIWFVRRRHDNAPPGAAPPVSQ
jgi:predicted MFS family arabinose efflux permease